MFGFVSPWTKLRLRREAKQAEALRLEELERQERQARANKLRADMEAQERKYYADRLEKISSLSAMREQQAKRAHVQQLHPSSRQSFDTSDSVSMLTAMAVIESVSSSACDSSSSDSSSSSDCSSSGSSFGSGD